MWPDTTARYLRALNKSARSKRETARGFSAIVKATASSLHPFAPFPRNRSEKRSRHFRRLYLSFGQEAESLLQLGRNARELAVERGADRIDRRNDHDRDTGGDQAVFNCSRTRLVLEKRKQLRHLTHSI